MKITEATWAVDYHLRQLEVELLGLYREGTISFDELIASVSGRDLGLIYKNAFYGARSEKETK